MGDRKPVRDDYDAELVLMPFGEPARDVYAIVKETFDITEAGPRRAAPQPLVHDIREGDTWPPGSDFWPLKNLVDVVVDGFAFGANGQPFSERRVAIEVGDRRKEGLVFGRRVAELDQRGAWRFEKVESVDRVPLVPESAYGGTDLMVPSPPPSDLRELLDAMADHPGAYPRNRFGRGYVATPRSPGAVVELPSLEDPAQRLQAESFGTNTLETWHRQPLPWFLHWLMPYDFPRSWFVGADPRHRIPEGEVIEEVRRGWLIPEWRSIRPRRPAEPPLPHAYYQEASPQMRFSALPPGTPIRLGGMHPERDRVEVVVPSPPDLEIAYDGEFERCAVRTLHVVIRPHDLQFDVTWVASKHALPRAFLPGVHAHIPLAVRVNGDAPVPYDTPEPVRASLERALAAAGGSRRPGESLISALRVAGVGQPKLESYTSSAGERHRFGEIEAIVGAARFDEVDFTLSGPAPLVLARHYDSSVDHMGLFGRGWSSLLDTSVRELGSEIVLRMSSGRSVALSRDPLATTDWYHHPATGLTIRRTSPDEYLLLSPNGWRRAFRRESSEDVARLSAVHTPDGSLLRVGYDAFGRMDRMALRGQPILRFEVGEDERLHRIFGVTRTQTDWVLLAHYEYDAEGQLRRATDGLGQTSTYQYENRRLARSISRTGDAIAYRHGGADGSARCVATTRGTEGRRVETAGAAVSVADSLGHSFVIEARNGGVVRVLDPFANETTRELDEASGLVSSMTTLDGETSYLYDASYHLADVSAPDAGSVALEHDAEGRLTSLRDADGHTETAHWDSIGRLSARTDRCGAGVVYGYDGEGALTSILTPAELELSLERDATGKAIVAVRSPLGDRRAERDALGRVVGMTDELGAAHRFAYDPTGRVKEHRLPADVRVTCPSGADGRLTGWSDGARALELDRDPRGDLTHVDEGGGEGPRLHRDAEGRVSMVESEDFDYWELHRDAAGRVIEESGFAGEGQRALRDHRGLVKRASRGRSRTTVTRDRAGRPTALEHGDETFQRYAWTPGGRLARAQDADRVVTFAHDGAGRLVSEKSDGAELTSRYDANGGRVALDSSRGLALRVERDALGNAMKLTATQGAQRLELTFVRDAAGRETRRRLPGGLELRWVRDGLGRATRRAVCFGDKELSALEMSYAGLDRLLRVNDSQRGVRALTHDARGRLVQVGELVRALDAVGRVFRNAERDDHTYEGVRLVESYGTRYAHDDAGRRAARTNVMDETTRYVWDGGGRLVRVELADGDRVSYDYDGLGRLVSRRRESRVEIPGVDEPVWEATSETELVWDGLALLHEIEGSRVTTWIREAGQLVGKLSTDGAWAALTDPLGIVTELTDAKGNLAWRGSVDLFGTATLDAAHTSNPWRLPGHWEDPDTGLAHAWLRVYDPDTGAYLSPSPLGIVGGSNLYEYLPDPLSETSPLGLGRGYATLGGEVRSERLEAELVERFVAALDRGDGCAGPRGRFDPSAARWRAPDPEAALFGPWESLRPSRRMPPPSSIYTRLPKHLGLSPDDGGMGDDT
ncbi:MAG: DUF2169 domain-containing protein [Sandaracinaceae bacterium]|nr:DUF2169 domain-containing protein [Sandaracinaceae bacterium]